MAARRWSPEMLGGLGVDRAVLPSVVESSAIRGKVSAEGAARTGLAEGTPIGGGGQASSAIGNGIVEPGAASCTLGTSGVVFAHLESRRTTPRAASIRSAMPCRTAGR